ncbi:MAG: DinB family protein, partial [Planctomycetota bacterium]|nr:DinB family protein [Planctomycetota bacterium]
ACKKEYACYVRDRGGDVDFEGAEHVVPPSPKAARRALEEAHAWLRHEVEALEPGDLALQANPQMKLDEFLAMIVRHDIWHAGQMAVVRRLYRNR